MKVTEIIKNKCLPLQMFCNSKNKGQVINNNQYNVVAGHKLIFLKMDPKYPKKIHHIGLYYIVIRKFNFHIIFLILYKILP